MHVVAIAQQKGGVMKSTLAIHIAAEAQRKGKRAIILELDTQGTVSFWAKKRRAIAANDLLKGADSNGLPPEVMQIEATQLTQTLSLLSGRGVALAVLDLPGSHNTAVNEAIKASNFVLLPTRPHETDIVASAEPLAVVQRLRKPYAYVITFVEAPGTRADEAQSALEDEGHPVCPQFIGRRLLYAEAVSEGMTVMEKKDPQGKAANEIKNLWKWLDKQLGATVEKRDERAAQAYPH
jgi:chromosome partitioning protein